MKYLILISFLSFMNCAIAQDKPDQGWYFYDTEPEPVKALPIEEDKPVTSAPAPKAKEKKPMTTAWMRKMLPIFHEQAIDNPTEENVAAYAYMVRVLGDKAQRYTEVHADLIKTDPFLDMNNTVPFNGTLRGQIISNSGEKKREALRLISKKIAGIIVFFDSKCTFCKTQIASVGALAKRINMDVQYISVDGKDLPGATGWIPDNGLAQTLGVKFYPTTMLAIPPKSFVPVSFGLMAQDQLESGVLAAAKAAKLIPKDMASDMNPYDRGVLTVDDMSDGAYDDPKQFVEYTRIKLKDRY